jgi:hypothetical protein
MRNIKEIPPARFNAFADWTRGPCVGELTDELEYYADTFERVLGVLTLDYTDQDFGYVILGRDEALRFRCIDVKVSMPKLGMARSRLKKALKQHSQTGKVIFPQGDGLHKSVDLFQPQMPEDRWHPSFKALLEYPHWQPAISIMSEMMRHFVDVDGHFVKEFQSNGFDARIWELYLYAYLKEERLHFDREHHSPDYIVGKYGKKVAIEAVTINPSGKVVPVERAESGPLLRSQEEINQLLENQVPIKFASTLTGKLNKQPAYWELEHVKGLPLVFALADFHEPQSMTWTFPAVLQYLYGISHEFAHDADGQLTIGPLKINHFTKENGAQVQAGFFFLPEAENVSAVLFSNSGTLSKFNRMGRLAGFGDSKSLMFRSGVCHQHDPNSAFPLPFHFEVIPGKATETWAEGLSMFHNPNAKQPVPCELFPSIAHHEFRDGQIHSLIPDFHPYASVTFHLRVEESKPGNSSNREKSMGSPISRP